MKTHLLRWCVLGGFACLVSCSDWRYDVTEGEIAFRRVRESGQLRIAELKSDAVIAGRPCRRGWVHLHRNGQPAAFTAATEIRLPRLIIPARTWVLQNETGTVTGCAFPTDIEIQGHRCRGTGGPKGVQVTFHPGGDLKQFYPARDVIIDGVPCDSGLVRGIVELHENGRLKRARLSRDWTSAGRLFRKGTRLDFDADGRPHSP
jgi:hypothetical protein